MIRCLFLRNDECCINLPLKYALKACRDVRCIQSPVGSKPLALILKSQSHIYRTMISDNNITNRGLLHRWHKLLRYQKVSPSAEDA